MTKLSKLTLGKQAKELGFVRDTYEKICRLTDILKIFESDELLGKYLALKGGTAINLTIFNLLRLSVDIDLDFSENLARDEMLALRNKINDRLLKYTIANGYSLSPKSRYRYALDSYIFEYTNSIDMNDNIKIEINYMLRCHLLSLEKRYFESTWEPEGVRALCLAPIEIFASKIVALFNRTAPRDLYDIHNLIKFGLFDEMEKVFLRKCVVYYSAITSKAPTSEFNLSNIDRITENQIKRELKPVLCNKERFELKTAQSEVQRWLIDLLKLEDNEREFLNSFKNRQYLPELIFDSEEILKNIRNHPMAKWKCMEK